VPQVEPSQGTPTRSPDLKRVTAVPVAVTRPTISWPGMIGSLPSVS